MKRNLLNGDKELHFLLAYELDKPERMSAFIQTADLWESPYWYWKTFRSIWVSVENGEDYAESFDSLFARWPRYRGLFMDLNERRTRTLLPDRVVVFRGEQEGAEANQRWSWSLSAATAKWFATRWGLPCPTLLVGEVAQPDILGVLLDRDEQEVVVSPTNVTVISDRKLTATPQTGGSELHMMIQTGKLQTPLIVLPQQKQAHLKHVERLRRYGLEGLAVEYENRMVEGLEVGLALEEMRRRMSDA